MPHPMIKKCSTPSNKIKMEFLWSNTSTKNFFYFEGPALSPDGTQFCFTEFELRKGTIYKIDSAMLKQGPLSSPPPVLYQGEVCNGLKFDSQKRLWACQMSSPSRIVEVDLITGNLTKRVTQFENKEFNCPNDIVIDEQHHGVYFTDPKIPFFPAKKPQKKERVYFHRDGVADPVPCLEKTRIEFALPNGIELQKDSNGNSKYLYVADSFKKLVWRFLITGPGQLEEGAIFVEFPERPVDGMAIHPNGDLYVTSGNYIYVIDPNGNRRDCFCPDPKDTDLKPSNLCFLDQESFVVTSYKKGEGKLYLGRIK
ncbi:SMP-30/gluconolactonase/LRE family protein [uncultured Gimesia sp.]|uniref:SMP-30/gluconolactonase/LRE family protein n=1 Tax=uncultured Gimesia sp. TaxID=1678688 RepID=UPI0030DAFCCD